MSLPVEKKIIKNTQKRQKKKKPQTAKKKTPTNQPTKNISIVCANSAGSLLKIYQGEIFGVTYA